MSDEKNSIEKESNESPFTHEDIRVASLTLLRAIVLGVQGSDMPIAGKGKALEDVLNLPSSHINLLKNVRREIGIFDPVRPIAFIESVGDSEGQTALDLGEFEEFGFSGVFINNASEIIYTTPTAFSSDIGTTLSFPSGMPLVESRISENKSEVTDNVFDNLVRMHFPTKDIFFKIMDFESLDKQTSRVAMMSGNQSFEWGHKLNGFDCGKVTISIENMKECIWNEEQLELVKKYEQTGKTHYEYYIVILGTVEICGIEMVVTSYGAQNFPKEKDPEVVAEQNKKSIMDYFKNPLGKRIRGEA